MSYTEIFCFVLFNEGVVTIEAYNLGGLSQIIGSKLLRTLRHI